MNESKQVVNEVFTYLAAGDVKHAENCMTDDFKSSVLNSPVDKDQYISAFASLRKGLPDLKIRLHDVEETGNGERVHALLDLTGTHSAEIPAFIPGYRAISPSGKLVKADNVELEISLKDRKINGIKSVKTGRGVFNEVLSQITA